MAVVASEHVCELIARTRITGYMYTIELRQLWLVLKSLLARLALISGVGNYTRNVNTINHFTVGLFRANVNK